MATNGSTAAVKDYKYQRYKSDLEGWKVLDNCCIHNDDRSLKDFVRIPRRSQIKDGELPEYYEANVIGVALFGLGRIGTIHLEHLIRHPQFQLMYIVENLQERARYVEFKWNLQNAKVLASKDSDIVFSDPKVAAVIVCTPTNIHEVIVIKALQAGKAVLCEKPLSDNVEGIRRCYELSKKVQKPLLCAFNRRFDFGFKDIKERVSAGEVGKVQVVKTCSRDCPLPSIEYLKISGGIFHDCAVHDIDLICWIVGEYPNSVTAVGHTFVPEIAALNDYDTVGIMMKFPSGTIGIIDLSRNAVYGYDQRLEVFGQHGMLTSTDLRPTAVASHTTIGTTKIPIHYSFASRYYDAYALEMDHFLDVVQGKCSPIINDRSTVAVSRIASACEESAKTGKTTYLQWEND